MTETTPSNAQTEIQTEITLNDIKLMISIIDLASARGLFKGNELSVVGNLYEKLTTVTKSVK